MDFKEFYDKNKILLEGDEKSTTALERAYSGVLKNRERLEIFEELLVSQNKLYNLTAISEHDDILIKHFFDSLLGEVYFKINAKVVEIGSGAGFPSVPLMLSRGDLRFTLVESIGKKCRFLESACQKLNLKATVLNMRAEDAAAELRESFDVACARAVARLATLLEYCLPFVKVGGYFVAYKGADEGEVEEAANALMELGGKIENIDSYEFEGLGKRTIIVVKKVKKTPTKYPRGKGLERRAPL